MSKTIDEFLAEANRIREIGPIDNAKISEESHIYNFIKDNGIKEGKNTVPIRYIYALYCEQNRPAIRAKRFAMYFKNFFKKYFTADKTFYRLDGTPFNLPKNYTIWKELSVSKFQYKKTKYNNIKSTPEGWMIFLEIQQGRKVFGFCKSETLAAKRADKIAWFYYGPSYEKFNFRELVIDFKDTDPELQNLLTLKKDSDGKTKKESL